MHPITTEPRKFFDSGLGLRALSAGRFLASLAHPLTAFRRMTFGSLTGVEAIASAFLAFRRSVAREWRSSRPASSYVRVADALRPAPTWTSTGGFLDASLQTMYYLSTKMVQAA
jgi:hypothetical protein